MNHYSILNFGKTYFDISRLICNKDKKSVIFISIIYMISIALLSAIFVILISMIKSLMMNADYSLMLVMEFSIFGNEFAFKRIYLIFLLLVMHLGAALCLYLAQLRWYRSVENIVMDIFEDSYNVDSTGLVSGSMSLIRVSHILLNCFSPALISIVSFVILLIFNWKIGFIFSAIVLIALYYYTLLGREVKEISANDAYIDEEDEGITVNDHTKGYDGAIDKIKRLSKFLQLKLKSMFIANTMFFFSVALIFAFIYNISSDADQVYKSVISIGLVLICFNGVKVVGSKAAPLSRNYDRLRIFLQKLT